MKVSLTMTFLQEPPWIIFTPETIAVVLLYEAKNEELISDISEASKLTTEQWRKAVAAYNGSDEYARKVYEYLPYITELLD